ncbi:NET1-associated nuclear protein 1 [Candida viswanathii]|uniref:NET1-associated nuclear protein 1 n=1 Tax=Candida viswanathii TaxID=5486 RepID=A0A367XZU2_9ASCO|nr:NET1-associated nuclear protein 1 [Candida viswanathii]
MPSAVSDWSLSMATGGKPVYLPYSQTSASVYSQDGRYIIMALAHQLRVYFISTRQCIKTIDLELADLADIKLDVTSSNQVLLFKSSGELVTVNWKDKVSQPIVSTISIKSNLPILSVISVKHLSCVIVTGRVDKKKNGSAPHTRYISYFDRNLETLTPIIEVSNSINFAVSLDNSKVAFVTSDNEINLFDLAEIYKIDNIEGLKEEDISKEVIPFIYKSSITSIAVSNDSVVALGTSSGPIQIVYGGLITPKPQRVLKWHLDQVKSLCFTEDNNYLLSGGMEKVLVFWQLETEKKQFLPRLNGTIDKISIDAHKNDYISLELKVDSTDNNYEILVISAIDLVSRLSVNTIRPKFAHNIKNTINKTKKKYTKNPSDFDKLKIRYDYSCNFEIHPKTKNLYFPNDSNIQAFDLFKNEQVFIQHAAPVLNVGKVRSETKLLDPLVTLLKFTRDGEWMCTFDEFKNTEVDSLLLKNEKQYALKFWKFIENKDNTASGSIPGNSTKSGHWELTTKILDPHGSNPILAMIPAPTSYFNGLAFLTADNKGGLRIWRPSFPKEAYRTSSQRSQQTAWALRKARSPGALSSEAVALSWSDDNSLIFLGHECSITTINSRTLEDTPDFAIPSLSGSRVRSLNIVDNNLVVLSKTRISSFDLISGELTGLVAKVSTTYGGKNLIAIDPLKKLICLALNYYDTTSSEGDSTDTEKFTIKSKILVFKPDQLKPVSVQFHDSGVSSIRYFNSSFIFVDLDCRVGTVYNTADEITETVETGLTQEINNMLITAQATADIINDRNVDVKLGNQGNGDGGMDIDDGVQYTQKVVDLHTFQPIFQNLEGVQIESLFDRIVNVLK